MKIIDIKDLRLRKVKSAHEGKLREFENYYEYCLVDDYEMLYDKFQIESIQMDDIFVSILEHFGQLDFVSIQFPKTYDVHEIVEWIDGHVISFNKRDKSGYYVEGAEEIIKGVLYKSKPLIIANKGTQKIYVNQLDEVTEEYERYSEIINTERAKTVDLSKTKNAMFEKPNQWIDDVDKDDWIDAEYPGVCGDDEDE